MVVVSYLVLRLFAKALDIVVKAGIDNVDCLLTALNLVNDRFFAFEGFVNREEMAHFIKYVLGKLRNIVAVGVAGVIGTDGDYFFVVFAAVLHGDNTNRSASDEGHWFDRFAANHQNVQRVAIVAIGSWDETVVGRVVGGGVEYAVKDDHTGFLVQLEFLFAALGDLDNCNKLLGSDSFGVDVVPDV